MKSLLLVSALIYGSTALLFGDGDKWDGLKAGFGVNPFDSFLSYPRTEKDAVGDGWTLDKSAGGCGVSGTAFNGNRYRKDGDQAMMILFDKNGFIAGVQAGIPKTQTATYPGPQNSRYHVFNEESDMWVITAYFVDPDTICTTGRSQADFDRDGTGTMLAFQTGKSVSSLMKIPMVEDQVTSTTQFVEGNCFYTMGKHYWYNIQNAQMSCDDTFPVFLLYNGGKLNAFGWAFNPDYSNSKKWEHPTRTVFGAFMKTVPDCLGKDGPVSTLHIYMTSSPLTNVC